MKKTIKRLLAVIFAIAMAFTTLPDQTEIAEAAKKTKYYGSVFFSAEFYGEAPRNVSNIWSYIKNTRGTSTEPVIAAYEIDAAGWFTKYWNEMPYKQDVVVINLHGDYKGLYSHSLFEYLRRGTGLIVDTNSVKQLAYKEIKYIVLLGCDTGNYNTRASNIARAFADKFNTTVIAPDGNVQMAQDGIEGHYTAKRWLAYTPKNSSNNYQGKLYQINNLPSATSVYTMIHYYDRMYRTELPAK